MKKTTLSLLVLFLVCPIQLLAQEKESEVPNVFSQDWSLVSEEEIKVSVQDGSGNIEIPFLSEFFYNRMTDKLAALISPSWMPKSRLMMSFEGSQFFVAIKIDSVWYRAKTSNTKIITATKRNNDGKLTGIKVSLDTVDGIKEIFLVVH